MGSLHFQWDKEAPNQKPWRKPAVSCGIRTRQERDARCLHGPTVGPTFSKVHGGRLILPTRWGSLDWAASRDWGIPCGQWYPCSRVAGEAELQEPPGWPHHQRGRHVGMMQGKGGIKGTSRLHCREPVSLSHIDFWNTKSWGEMVSNKKEITERVFESTKTVKIED